MSSPDPRDELIAMIDDQLRELAGRDPWANVVGTLESATAAAAEESRWSGRALVNPKPRGSMVDGRSTRIVLDAFERSPDAWLRKRHLMWRCPSLTGKAVDWALLQLRRLGRIEYRISPTCDRFLVYRLATQRGAASRITERSDG